MKLLPSLLVISFFISTSVFSKNYIPNQIKAKVVDIFIGEIDAEIGEKCIIFVKDINTRKKIAFVSDQLNSTCEDAEMIKKDWIVKISKSDLSFIKDKLLLASLKSFDKNFFYLFQNNRLELSLNNP